MTRGGPLFLIYFLATGERGDYFPPPSLSLADEEYFQLAPVSSPGDQSQLFLQSRAVSFSCRRVLIAKLFLTEGIDDNPFNRTLRIILLQKDCEI